MNTIYHLSYEERGEKKIPTLIISILLNNLGQALLLLRDMAGRNPDEEERRYLFKRGSFPFKISEARFGYRGCGKIEYREDRAYFIFPLKSAMARETSASISELLGVLSAIRENRVELVSNGSQIFMLDTIFGFETHFSHNISGNKSPLFEKWLEEYYESHPKVKKGYGAASEEVAPLPDNFEDAMTRSWQSLFGRKIDGRATGAVREGRLFTFGCPGGSATSAGIYPNEWNIGSHNVWSPEMQLTLLVGIFSLFDMIVKHPDATTAP